MTPEHDMPSELDLPAPWQSDALERARRFGKGSLSPFSDLLIRLYRFRRLRGYVRSFCNRLELGPIHSQTWLKILARYHNVHIGPYSYGAILNPSVLPSGTRVGAYCSVGQELIVRRRDHPVRRPFLHPFFYDKNLGLVTHDTIPETEANPLTIGNDVWIGARVTILGGCTKIGNGAILAGGAVVTKDVAPYTIVAGLPAKPLKRRFDDDMIATLEESRWWEHDIATVLENLPVKDVFDPKT